MSPLRFFFSALVLAAVMGVAPSSALAGNTMGAGAPRIASAALQVRSSSATTSAAASSRSASAQRPSSTSGVYAPGVRWVMPPAKPTTLAGKAKAFKANFKANVKGALAHMALGY